MVLKFLLDDREHSQTLKEAFYFTSINRIFDYETAHLEIGDVQCGNVCIERKEASDFVGSIMDGRLKSQSYKMNLGFEYKYIIVEGNPFKTGSAIGFNSIIGMMTSLLVKHNIKLMFVEDELQFCEACYSIVKKHMEEHQFNSEYVPSSIPKKTDDEILAMMLMQINGVSFSKAKLIANLYDNSLYKFVNNVTPGRLTTLDGIGKVLAKRIYDFIGKQ